MAWVRDFMQGSHCHRKTWINILLGILQLLLPCVQHGGAQLQALSQMSSVVEVWQAEDADPLVPTQVEEERSKDSLPLEVSASFYMQENGRPLLLFQPPSLEFGTQPLGLPRAETIYIHNPSQDLPVTLVSMFTSSRHFYMPSFHRRVIPPRGKASFKMVFLPTEEGNVENSLFINTSTHGLLSYQVFGEGVQRESLKGVNRKESVLIFPHIQSIKLSQIQEDACNVTTLGLLLECSLPKSLYSQPQGSFLQNSNENVPPAEEQRVSFQIKLSERAEHPADLDKLKPYVTEHILVLLVAPATGRTATAGEPKLKVYMLNSGGKKLYVKEMQLLSKGDSTLDFSPVQLRASSANFTQVATLACRTGPLPDTGRRCSSHISLQVLVDHTLNIFPGFHNTHGGLELSSLIQVTQRGGDLVDLWLTNAFRFPLPVHSASLSPESQGLLTVVNFSKEAVVPRAGCWRLLSLQLLNRRLPLNILSTLSLHTGSGQVLHLPLHIHSTLAKQGDVVFEADGECARPCPLRLSEAGRVQWQHALLPDGSSSWALDSKLAAELCSRWQCRKDLLPCRWPRLPVETSSSIEFGATPVNESKVKMMTLKNPSSSVVSMEIRALSQYPAPLDALDLLTKWFNISPISVNVSTTEFTLLPAQPKEGVSSKGAGVLRVVLQPWESRDVAVVFTPSEHKHTTTILLIRNNLTVFDMVSVQGHGAKELLRVGGKLPGPGASLRFNVPQSTLMECRDGLRTNKPLFAIRKSFKVENAGELPLTVMSMNVNGYKCQGFGFEVLHCRSFSLEHNSSAEISIAFTPDFTSSWVIRDLTLVTSRGSLFPFTLNVTLPHHMLPLCAQVVPGPSWEESFWVITLIFTCFSLAGVCLMAFHQAQYILMEFFTPTPRSNHNSITLSRDNAPVNNITPNGVNKTKGSCKTYTETSSDKGKGRGSPAVANGSAPRSQSSSSSKKGSSTAPSQPQKKHKVSLYYSKYKTNTSASVATAAVTTEEERELDVTPDLGTLEPDLSPEVCNNNNNEPAFLCPVEVNQTSTTMQHFEEAPTQSATKQEESKCPATVMFPVETPVSFPNFVSVSPGPRPGLLLCSQAPLTGCSEHVSSKSINSAFPEKTESTENRHNTAVETREEVKIQRKKPDKVEAVIAAVNNKGKKNRRKNADGVPDVPEHSIVLMSEREREHEWRAAEQRNMNVLPHLNRMAFVSRGHGGSAQSGRRHASPVQTQAAHRVVCGPAAEAGAAGAPPVAWREKKDASAQHQRNTHHCTTSARKRDSMQYSGYPSERDCYQKMKSTYKAQSMNIPYRKEPCQSPSETPTTPPSFPPSFAAVAASSDRGPPEMTGQYLPEETWSPPSVPLTNEFRYNTSEAPPYVPQASVSPINGFPWNSTNSQCNSPYTCDQGNYMSTANSNFHSGFPCQLERETASYSHQPSWREDCSQESPSTWGTASCVGSKPYFPGTRSLSPMSSLFGSIWTPQSDPYQNHFQQELSAPMSPVSSVCPVTPTHVPFNREPGGLCRPKQYSSFNPFGPHMNLDIWNSSSNRSSNSQLSNDSGYCGDV
ncbi:hypothetical protein UPYG_G00041460 [Umbra pygmaea]|uniref:Transmembrane protein 131-like n=1 Tax=Umbra pygmaea TaxID=75934 RepID=A0ABD0XQ86_UMBPY